MHQDLGQKPIKHAKLQNLVAQWIQSCNHLQKHPLYRYKFDLQTILPLPQNLLSNAILYTFYVTFPFLIENLTTDSKIQTSLSLKLIYSQQFYEGQWKKEFIFQFIMIYLTKTISKFMEDHFPNLQINENLQSQIFIILSKVFIGTQVGTKIYNVTAKKYLKVLDQKITKKSDVKDAKDVKPNLPLSKHKKETLLTMSSFKQSTKYFSELLHPQNFGSVTRHKISQLSQTPSKNIQKIDDISNNFKRNPVNSRISFIRPRIDLPQQKSTLQIFNQQLKDNLHVDPLTKAGEVKYDINSYEQMKSSSIINNKTQSVEKKKQSLIEGRKQKRQRTLQISSGKISQSMEVNLSLNKQEQNKLSATAANIYHFPRNSSILLGSNNNKLINFTKQLNLKHHTYTPFLQKKNSLLLCCDSSAVGDASLQRKVTGDNPNTRSMILPSCKNRNKSQVKFTLDEWNQLLKSMKGCTKSGKSSEKENKKKFIQRKQSNIQGLYQGQQKPHHSFERHSHDPFHSTEAQNNFMTLKLKTQSNQRPFSRHSRNPSKDKDDNTYTKIDVFTATTGETFQYFQNSHHENQKLKSKTINIRKNSNIWDGQNLHKLSKTRKIKLSKLQFLTECKKREQNLQYVKSFEQLAKSAMH